MTPTKSRKHCFQQSLAKLMGKLTETTGGFPGHEDTKYRLSNLFLPNTITEH